MPARAPRLAALAAALVLLTLPVLVAAPAGADSVGHHALLATGQRHACLVVPSGALRCWGYADDGALGYLNSPVIGDDELPRTAGDVDLGPGRTATAIAAGSSYTCAVLDTGAVECWGIGGDGELGYGNTDSTDQTPGDEGTVDLGPGRTAAAIAVGTIHTCVILDTGAVKCWGYGGYGALGYGNTDDVGDDETPAAVGTVNLGPGRTATAIAAGDSHTCVILDTGSVKCWGDGYDGQLGYGNTAMIGDDETPAAVGTVDLGPGRTAIAIAAGDVHTCVILDTGAVKCWGWGGRGQLGYGNTQNIGDDETPAGVGAVDLGPGRTAIAISTGEDATTCAVLDTWAVLCWGTGHFGVLGHGNTANVGDDETPASVGPIDLGPGRTATAVSVGGNDFACAVLDTGALKCWGRGQQGVLGTASTNNIGDDETPAGAPTAKVASTPEGPPTASVDSTGHVSWTAPLDDGGSAVTGYAVTVSPTAGVTGSATRTAGAGATSLDFGGLGYDRTYSFTVAAVNANGTGYRRPVAGTVRLAAPPAPATTSTTVPAPTTSTTIPSPPTTTVPPPSPASRPGGGGTTLVVAPNQTITVTPGGRVTTTGTASFGEIPADTSLNAPIVNLGVDYTFDPAKQAWEPTGYWLVGRDGGVFSFGTAEFHGSTGDKKLNQPVVGITPTSTGDGYWLVAADGGVFAFGDAKFLGSTGAKKLNQPVVALAPTPDGKGYWLLGADGGIFAFGTAGFHGSAAATGKRYTGIVPSPTGRGYDLVAADGTITSFGDA